MIDWVRTNAEYGISGLSLCKLRKSKICVACDVCGVGWDICFRSKVKKEVVESGDYATRCRTCVGKDPDHLDKLRQAALNKWQDQNYIDKNLAAVRSENNRKILAERAIGKKQSAAQRKMASECTKKQWSNPKFRELVTESSKAIWQDQDLVKQMLESRNTANYKNNQRIKAIERWSDPSYIEKQVKVNWTRSAEHLAGLRQMQSKVSKPQEVLYSILDDLGVKYFREYNDGPDDLECTIGPYSFDCVIPREGQKTILLECHGDYWHSISKNDRRDRAKESYILNHFQNTHELRVLWEHQILAKDYAVECLKQWLGIERVQKVDFSFSDVSISKPPADEYRTLLAKYHYLVNAGRSGIVYGAYVGGILAAVAVYSPPVRQNYDPNTVRELSRLCIHPSYQKKNFASWFISKTLKLLPKMYSTVVSFSDTTFNHVGTVYRASNFVLDGEVAPDYWYVNSDGWVMHKKTLYNHAVKMGHKESEYALMHDYVKVWGSKKLRYKYHR